MRRGVRVGLLAGFLLLRLRLFLLMLSAAPGRFGRGLLAHAGRVSYAPITGLRGLAGRWDFSERLPFFLLRTCLESGALFLGERPPGALYCDAVGRGANPEHSLM